MFSVQAAQPQGVHLPRTLWEYRKDFPIRASVYFSGLLAAPRLTIFWLLVSEREMVQRVHDAAVLRLQVILGEARHGNIQVWDASALYACPLMLELTAVQAACMRDRVRRGGMIASSPPEVKLCSSQGWGKASADGAAGHRSLWRPFGGRPVSSFMGQSWIFWVMTACLPGIQVRSRPWPNSHSSNLVRYTLHLDSQSTRRRTDGAPMFRSFSCTWRSSFGGTQWQFFIAESLVSFGHCLRGMPSTSSSHIQI